MKGYKRIVSRLMGSPSPKPKYCVGCAHLTTQPVPPEMSPPHFPPSSTIACAVCFTDHHIVNGTLTTGDSPACRLRLPRAVLLPRALAWSLPQGPPVPPLAPPPPRTGRDSPRNTILLAFGPTSATFHFLLPPLTLNGSNLTCPRMTWSWTSVMEMAPSLGVMVSHT